MLGVHTAKTKEASRPTCHPCTRIPLQLHCAVDVRRAANTSHSPHLDAKRTLEQSAGVRRSLCIRHSCSAIHELTSLTPFQDEFLTYSTPRNAHKSWVITEAVRSIVGRSWKELKSTSDLARKVPSHRVSKTLRLW